MPREKASKKERLMPLAQQSGIPLPSDIRFQSRIAWLSPGQQRGQAKVDCKVSRRAAFFDRLLGALKENLSPF